MATQAIIKDCKYNYADYKTWNDDERWEIINGEVYNMSPAPMRIHQEISKKLLVKFENYLNKKKVRFIMLLLTFV